jgi:hypothetical protein
VLLFLVSPLVAFLINGLRCFGLIFNPHADIASIHSLQGIAMLLIGVLLLYFIDGQLARLDSPSDAPSLIERRARRDSPARGDLGRRVAGLVGFSAVLVALSWLPPFAAPSFALSSPASVIEPTFEGWQGGDQTNDWMFLGTTRFGQILNRRYARGEEEVDVFVAQAASGGRVRNYLSPKAAFPGTGWITEREAPARIAGRDATLRVLRKGATRLLSVSWFESSPGLAVESARSLFALDSTGLWPRARIPLAVRLSTPLSGSANRATQPDLQRDLQRLELFAEHLSPALQALSTPRES